MCTKGDQGIRVSIRYSLSASELSSPSVADAPLVFFFLIFFFRFLEVFEGSAAVLELLLG